MITTVWKSKTHYWMLTICFIVAFILFGNSIPGGYVLDDFSVIARRIDALTVGNLGGIFLLPWHQGQPWAGNYRPLTLISFTLNFVFSKSTAWLHVVNIGLHALNVFMVFLIASLFLSKNTAYLAAAWFMLWPIHVEPVASIVGRSDLLSAFLMLLTLWYFWQSRHALGTFFFALALLAKDFSVALLPVLFGLSYLESKRLLPAVKTGAYYLIPLPFYFSLRFWALGQYAFQGQGFIDPIIGPLAFVTLKERVFTAFKHFYFYLEKTFYPVSLSPDYSYNQIPVVSNIFTSPPALGGLVLLLLTGALLFSKSRGLKIGAWLMLATYATASNIFFIATGTMAERWWYFPSSGLALIAAAGWQKISAGRFRPKILIHLLLIALFVWYAWLIVKQNRIWLSNKTLITHAAEQSPRSAWAITNLAAIYLAEGRYDQARTEVERALAISDRHIFALNILGQLDWRDGRYREAEANYKKALALDKNGRNHRSLYRQLAFLKLEQGLAEEAFELMAAVRQSQPFGDSDRIEAVDQALQQGVKHYRDKKFLSSEDKARIKELVRTVRGF